MTIIKICVRLREKFIYKDLERIEKYIKKKCGGYGDAEFDSEKPFPWMNYSMSLFGKTFILSYKFRSKSMSREKSEEKVCDELKKLPYVIEAHPKGKG